MKTLGWRRLAGVALIVAGVLVFYDKLTGGQWLAFAGSLLMSAGSVIGLG